MTGTAQNTLLKHACTCRQKSF